MLKQYDITMKMMSDEYGSVRDRDDDYDNNSNKKYFSY